MSDEWTMICPPGRMDEAVTMAEFRPENIREIAESPAAGDQFILINDTEMGRFWERFKAEPARFLPPPRVIDHWRWMPPLVASPASLCIVTGIGA